MGTLEALAARLRENAEIARDIADTLEDGERRRWIDEAETYDQAAIIVAASAGVRDGLARVRTVLRLNVHGKTSIPRETWLRVGALVELRCASRRPRGAVT